jgi:hypothetical protein
MQRKTERECRRNPNNQQNKLRSSSAGVKHYRGAIIGNRANRGGSNLSESHNNGSTNIIKSGSKQGRFRKNSNSHGSDRMDDKFYNNSRGDPKYSIKFI